MNPRNWTYGAEHEWADHPLSRDLPPGFERDKKDITIVNSNGIANDPKGKTYGFGGEINTPPTTTIEDQVGHMTLLKEHLPEATINYRSNLHLHIRVPGLGGDLGALKTLQRFIHDTLPIALPIIQPLPRPHVGLNPANPREEYLFDNEEYQGALRRWRRRRVSHQTLLTEKRLGAQLRASTTEEFFRLEVPHSRSGTPLWHFQPRLCVNVRQLLETDTIEFRHFAGTMDEEILSNSLHFCAHFLRACFGGGTIKDVLSVFATENFPPWPPYNHELEKRYRATCHDHTLPPATIRANIARILNGEFDA